MWVKQKGFTIVELLIVIVVIAILAAISVGVYNGVQERAQNTKTVAAVRSYLTALEIFRSDYGAYPSQTNVSGIGFYNCLGEEYTDDSCGGYQNGNKENVPLNTALKDIMGNKLPMPGSYPATQSYPGGGGVIMYLAADKQPAGGYLTLDGKPVDYLIYTIRGYDTPCPIGPVVSTAPDGITMSSTPPASGQTVHSETASCWLALQ